MTGSQVLLAGGGGFIGQALATRLAMAGHAVTILSRRAAALKLPGLTWRQGSLGDADLLQHLLPQCTAVVHLATTSTPGSYRDAPVREVDENLIPLLRLLEAMSGQPQIPLLYLSSGGAIYGNPHALPVSESHPLAPLSYHAAGKAAAEQFLGVFARAGHAVTILRPSNAYGPGQPLRQGFGVLRALLEHIRRQTPMQIWGDGNSVRDYLYIDDLTRACLDVLAQPAPGSFNLGSGVGHTLNELCDIARRVTGLNLEVHHRPARGTDVKAVVLDSTHFAAHYGWQPATSLEEGMARMWKWLQAQA